MSLETRIRNVFASANHRVRERQASEFAAQTERPTQNAHKAPRFLALIEQHSSLFFVPSGSKTGDLSLDQRQLNPSNARRFAGTENSLDRGLLEAINLYISTKTLAA
jgi:hypothetical protein